MAELEFSDEQVDYLREMMNIGSGNAARALSELLKTSVDSHVPKIGLHPLLEVTRLIGDPTDLVVGIRLKLLGDVMGYMFFMVAGGQRQPFTALAQQAMPAAAAGGGVPAMLEVARIIAGSFLNALRHFCGLSITQSTPHLAIDMLQAVMDEAIASVGDRMAQAIVIRNELSAVEKHVSIYLLIVPDRASAGKMVASIEQARRQFGIAPG